MWLVSQRGHPLGIKNRWGVVRKHSFDRENGMSDQTHKDCLASTVFIKEK